MSIFDINWDDPDAVAAHEQGRQKEGTISPEARAAISKAQLRKKLKLTDDGYVRVVHQNIHTLLDDDPKLRGLFVTDEFANKILVTRAPPTPDEMREFPGPYPRPYKDTDATRIAIYLQDQWSTGFTKTSMISETIMAAAELNRVHPVRDYIAKQVWDGERRVDNWLATVFGCPDDEYHRAIAAKFLIAAVRRVRRPGTKFDTMLVLEGKQGIGKSTACRVLFGDEWFTDQMCDLSNKDSSIQLQGTWCHEFSELDKLSKADVTTVKEFLSRPSDHYIPRYGRTMQTFPRQTVFVGTTNRSDYLRDETGNRRFWPVKCADAKANLAWLTENRDQLWAEAAEREAGGETIYLDNADLTEAAEGHTAERMAEDVWEDLVVDYTENDKPSDDPNASREPRMQVKIEAILEYIGLPPSMQKKPEQMRVAAILTSLGWSRATKHNPQTGRSHKVWIRPDAGPDPWHPHPQSELAVLTRLPITPERSARIAELSRRRT